MSSNPQNGCLKRKGSPDEHHTQTTCTTSEPNLERLCDMADYEISPIERLPDKIQLNILAHLSPRSLAAAGNVCSRFRRLSKMVPIYCESTGTLTLSGLTGDSLRHHLDSFPQRQHLVCRNVELSQEMIVNGVCGLGTQLRSLKFYSVTLRCNSGTPSEQFIESFFRALFNGSPLLEEVVWHNVVLRARNALSVGRTVFYSEGGLNVRRVQFSGHRLLFSGVGYESALNGFKNLQAVAITDRFRILDGGSFHDALIQLVRLRELYVMNPAHSRHNDNDRPRTGSYAASTMFGAVANACSELEALQVLVVTGMQIDRANVDKVLSLCLQVTLLKGNCAFNCNDLTGIGDGISTNSAVPVEAISSGILRYRVKDSPTFSLAMLNENHRTLSDLQKELDKTWISYKMWASSELSECAL